MSKRTHGNRYKQANRASANRSNFILRSSVKWLQANAPRILSVIQKEAEKRWPLKVIQRHTCKHDYSFVEKLKERKP